MILGYVAFAVVAAAIAGLCRLLRLNPVHPKIAQPRRSALCAIVAVAGTMLALYALVMLVSGHHKHEPMHHAQPKQLRNLMDQLLLILLYLLPMVLMLRLNRETFQSANLTRTNLWKATVVGLLVVTVQVLQARGGHGVFWRSSNAERLVALVFYSFVGFGEELLFRGYLQSRLVAWLGHYQGWALASISMALAHMPVRILQGLDFPHALASSLGLVPVSLFTGFLMLRTGNIVAPALSHTFADLLSYR